MLKIKYASGRVVVTLNGIDVATLCVTPDYCLIPLGEVGKKALVKGVNVIGISATSPDPPHFFDLGLIDMRPVE